MTGFLCWVAAFFIGAIPTAYILVRITSGRDIRRLGSGNAGATNVFRSVGRREGCIVLVLDAVKGFAAVTALPMIYTPADTNAQTFQFALGLGSILGHVFTPFLGFKGGKGVATGAGVALAVYPAQFAAAIVSWITILRISGYMSVASISGALIFAAATIITIKVRLHWALAIGAALFIIWTHRSNIVRLIRREEPKFIFHP